MGQPGLLILNHPHHVINVANIVKPAHVYVKMVKVAQIVVFLHLPVLVSQTSPLSWVVIEDYGFSRCDDWRPAFFR